MTYSGLGDCSGVARQQAACMKAKDPDCQGPRIQGSGVGANPVSNSESSMVSRWDTSLAEHVF